MLPSPCRTECHAAGAQCFAVGTARASVCRGCGVAAVTSCLEAVPPSCAAAECASCCVTSAAAPSHDAGMPLPSVSGNAAALTSCSVSGVLWASLERCAPLLSFRGSLHTAATCTASARGQSGQPHLQTAALAGSWFAATSAAAAATPAAWQPSWTAVTCFHRWPSHVPHASLW
jgi:hypothetical protein